MQSSLDKNCSTFCAAIPLVDPSVWSISMLVQYPGSNVVGGEVEGDLLVRVTQRGHDVVHVYDTCQCKYPRLENAQE